jgi:hypothetical protein
MFGKKNVGGAVGDTHFCHLGGNAALQRWGRSSSSVIQLAFDYSEGRELRGQGRDSWRHMGRRSARTVGLEEWHQPSSGWRNKDTEHRQSRPSPSLHAGVLPQPLCMHWAAMSRRMVVSQEVRAACIGCDGLVWHKAEVATWALGRRNTLTWRLHVGGPRSKYNILLKKLSSYEPTDSVFYTDCVVGVTALVVALSRWHYFLLRPIQNISLRCGCPNTPARTT